MTIANPAGPTMALWFCTWLATRGAPAAAAFEKITLRAALAAVLSFVVALCLGPRLIGWLRLRFRDPIVSPSSDVAALHRDKQWTPTMGGLFLVAGIVAAALLLADLANPYVLLSLLLVLALGLLGAVDDLTKLRGGRGGLTARTKLAWQLAIAGVVAVLAWRLHAAEPGGLALQLPLAGTVELGWLYVPLAMLVLVGASNAVNLTDGLDGLAGGCLIFAVAGMAAVAYVAGHAELAGYLHVAYIPGAGETVVLAGAMLGGLLGFLWFNCHPAQVFMGDTGSLPLGGLLGMLAIVARAELLLVVIGGVFVVEALSVILQLASYRWRRRKIFRCAPLHHHFQLAGWPESRIVVRFWIASALCTILGLAALKLNVAETKQERTLPTAHRTAIHSSFDIRHSLDIRH